MPYRTRALRLLVASSIATLLNQPARGQSQPLAWTGGVQYATGDYVFTRRTWSAYLSNGLAWSSGRWFLAGSIPVVLQAAGWVQYSGAGIMLPTGGMSGTETSTNSTSGGMMGGAMHGGTMSPSANMPFSNVGIGDPIGRIELALWQTTGSAPRLSLVGSAKAPLADVSHGFGTGEWDAGAGLSGSTTIGGMFVFADAMYWALGNPPGASLRNVVAYGLSVGRALPGHRWSLLGNVTGASSYWPGVEAPAQAGIGVGYLLASGSSLTSSGALGLTRTAPTATLGLGWRVPLGNR